MEDLNNNQQFTTRLQIAFPESSEDHRLQLIEINGSMFAIVFGQLESDGPIRLDCEDWSLVLISPIKSKTDVSISAVNVVCLNEIASEEGTIELSAANQLVKFAHLIEDSENVSQRSSKGEFVCDDLGTFLYYHRLFGSIVSCIHSKNPDSFYEAQQKIIMALCSLAEKVEGKPKELTLDRVLDVWNISRIQDSEGS